MLVTVYNITPTAAELLWTSEDGFTYNIEYGQTGFTLGEGTLIENVPNPLLLVNLSQNTGYDVYIQSNFDGILSDWSDVVSFTTTAVLPPSDLTASNIMIDSVELNWTDLGVDYLYMIQYGVKGFTLGEGTFFDPESVNSATILNLVDDTEYDVYIQSYSLTYGLSSEWSSPITFKTVKYETPDSALISVVFYMTGLLYNDIYDSPYYLQERIIKNAIASIYNINPYGLTIQNFEFNSIDVIFTAQGTFTPNQIEINMTNQTNIVNSFVNAANNSGLGTYTTNDVNLTGVNSQGNLVEADGNVISLSCFGIGSIVKTDQGDVRIENLDKDIHTIRGLKIKALTKTKYAGDKLVFMEKDSIAENVPSKNTVVSEQHAIFYKGIGVSARDFVNKFEKVNFIENKNKSRILYNVLLEDYKPMVVNNMLVESLHPDNILAKLYANFNEDNRKDVIKKLNEEYKKNNKMSIDKFLNQ